MQISFQELQQHTFTPMKRSGAVVPGWFIMYELDECEKCNGECMAVNAVNVSLSDADVAFFEVRENLPVELGWCDTFGGAVCDHCYVGEEVS